MILHGDLTAGQRLQEQSVAELLGMPSPPVRRALPALAGEGLLERAGRGSYVVQIFTLEEIGLALDIRASIEGMAARLVAERKPSQEVMQKLRTCLAGGDRIFAKRRLAKGDEFKFGRVNAEFHGLIVEAVSNGVMSAMIQKLHRVPFVSPSVIAFEDKGDRETFNLLNYAHRQHHDIVQAIAAGKGARAEAIFKEHVFSQKQSMNLGKPRMGSSKPPIAAALLDQDELQIIIDA
jgi:GntR family transcriptional regulator of vanillate catabolism